MTILQCSFLSGAYVSDKVVTKADDKDGSQMTLFDKGGKIPKRCNLH